MPVWWAWVGLGCVSDPTEDSAASPPPALDLCAEQGWTGREWVADGDFGPLRRQLADDFTVPTTAGDFVWSEQFTGCESYVFVPDSLVVSPLDPTPLLEQRADLKSILKDGPDNVHYFFLTTDTGASSFAESMAERISGALGTLSAEEQEWWAPRLHAVTKQADRLDGWVAEAMTAGGEGFAIDRFQRVRQFGGLADVTRFDPALDSAGYWPWQANLAYVAHEAQYYNHESDRQDRLDAVQWTPVYLFHDDPIAATGNSTVDVDLPDAATLATFDTLWIDLTHACDPTQMEFGNCDAWDAIETLYLCAVDDPTDCTEELARYITTYHREGRWLADASQLLPLLADGGRRRFQLGGTRFGHFNSLQLLFGKTRADGRVPFAMERLWEGGNWTETYDAEHPPLTVQIPADATEVKLHVTLSGHGGESDDNCSEFCNHVHTFTVNGVPYVASHDDIGDDQGCLKQIDQGTVPNQNGTWWFSRTSWCPGKQVDPWVWDITDQVVPGQPVEISYTTNWGQGVDGGAIVMSSGVTFWR
jgi:Peptide-N-glycosidase F, C terminal